jgi:hypothetical protein
MDVYLVPVATDRYELYCEIPDGPDQDATEAPKGRIRKLVHRFNEMLADAERERRQERTAAAPAGWAARIRAKMMRWVAESIAEQRLLWHLRSQTDACLHFPDDLTGADAEGIMRQQLGRDFEKHRFWLVIDALIFIASGLLALVPGPNLLAYYFAFRLVGHFFSMRGASRALRGIAWRLHASAPLTELRRVLTLAPALRMSRVLAVAESLHLEHLVSFYERSAVST